MEKTIGAFDARRRFGQLLEEVFYRHDCFVVERSGRPMAVVVPVDEYRRWQRLAKTRLFSLLEQAWERTAAVPDDELEKDAAEAIRALREEQRAEKGA